MGSNRTAQLAELALEAVRLLMPFDLKNNIDLYDLLSKKQVAGDSSRVARVTQLREVFRKLRELWPGFDDWQILDIANVVAQAASTRRVSHAVAQRPEPKRPSDKDVTVEHFLSKCTQPAGTTEWTTLYDSYLAFCQSTGKKALGGTLFKERVLKLGDGKYTADERRKIWRGLGLSVGWNIGDLGPEDAPVPVKVVGRPAKKKDPKSLGIDEAELVRTLEQVNSKLPQEHP